MKESSKEFERIAVTLPKRFCFSREGVASVDCSPRKGTRNTRSWGRRGGPIRSERALPKSGLRFCRVSEVGLVPSRVSTRIVCPEACPLHGILKK